MDLKLALLSVLPLLFCAEVFSSSLHKRDTSEILSTVHDKLQVYWNETTNTFQNFQEDISTAMTEFFDKTGKYYTHFKDVGTLYSSIALDQVVSWFS